MEEFDSHSEDCEHCQNSCNHEIIEDPELEKKSPRFLLFAVTGIILIFLAIFGLSGFNNIKLFDVSNPFTGATVIRASDDCYTFNSFEFCNIDDNWYTDIFNEHMNTIFTVGFHYDPDSVRDIQIQGKINQDFVDSDVYYVTFNPTKEDLKYTALASAELQLSMARAMKLPLKAACTTEHEQCKNIPIITCENTDKPVFFVDETDGEPSIIFDGNCISITGKGEELVRAVDRLLFFWYGVYV